MKYQFFILLTVVAGLIFIGCATETADVIQPTAIENIHFLPANIMLGTANIMLGNLDGRVPAEPMDDVASDQVLLKQTNPGIAPIQSSPHGKTYSAWPADWWDWALGSPASVHPLLDATGVNCGVNQSGQVWFLGGRLFGSGPIIRECTVPAGQSLFFPLINTFIGAFLDDPPAQRTEAFLRAAVDCVKDAEFPLVEIDGVAVDNPKQYLEESVLFDLFLPAEGLFGELTLSPSVDKGFYLFLNPLTPGAHTIKWQASSADCGFGQDITYNLTVE